MLTKEDLSPSLAKTVRRSECNDVIPGINMVSDLLENAVNP